MKKLVFGAVALGFSVAVAGCSSPTADGDAAAPEVETEEAIAEEAEPVEPVAFAMDEITCWDLTTADEEEQAFAATLVYGYAAGVAGTNDQSSEAIEAAIVSAFEFCGENPDSTALEAFAQGE